MSKLCSLDDGLKVCRELWSALVPKGYFPALTGGLVYKDGLRKDIDIVIYRHRQAHSSFEISDIEKELESLGFKNIVHYGFVTKAEYDGFTVDLFNPESGGEY